MKKIIFLALLAFLTAQVGFGQTGIAQKKQIIKEVTGVKVEKARGENPNIKTGVPTIDKPVEKQRGSCSIYFDNYTGYVINVYVDGYFKGTVDAFGGGWVNVGSGYTTIYCITVGGTYEWKDAGNCEGEYRFKLRI
jgi:hypothetical protein